MALLPLGRSLAVEATVQFGRARVHAHRRAPALAHHRLVHGPTQLAVRAFAARLAELPTPVVVTGDFNSTPYSPYFAEWLEQTGLTDARAPHAGPPGPHPCRSLAFRSIISW